MLPNIPQCTGPPPPPPKPAQQRIIQPRGQQGPAGTPAPKQCLSKGARHPLRNGHPRPEFLVSDAAWGPLHGAWPCVLFLETQTL